MLNVSITLGTDAGSNSRLRAAANASHRKQRCRRIRFSVVAFGGRVLEITNKNWADPSATPVEQPIANSSGQISLC